MDNKKLIEDTHYTFCEKSLAISFDTKHPQYILEKNVFATQGVNIDEIKTINEYDKYKMQFIGQIMAVIEDKWRTKKPKTLRDKLTKSIVFLDIANMKKYAKLLKKKTRLNLKIIK